MLFRIDALNRTAEELPTATLAGLQLYERSDLQEWVVHTPEILGEELLVIASEFHQFNRTSERLDVLALDRAGKLVVVELKRTAAGTAAELQALRYAAYCSGTSLHDAVEMHWEFLRGRGQPDLSLKDAEARIKAFVEEPEYSGPDDRVRIILAAEEFSPEITATVMWLTQSFDLDISCVRLRPYTVNGQLVLESSILIPLPEAEEFIVRRERKEAEQTKRVRRQPIDFREFIANVPESLQPVLLRVRDWLVSQPDVKEVAFRSLVTYRRASDRAWITVLELTKSELRISLPPSVPVEPGKILRKTKTGWTIVSVRTEEETAEALRLLSDAIALLGSLE